MQKLLSAPPEGWDKAWGVDRRSFILIFFMCALPLLNALSDWFSVSFTQYCLRHYHTQPKHWWRWIIADLAAALGFLLGLFFCIFGLLQYMAFCGWAVDPEQMLMNFTQEPFAQQNLWLILLVLTNLAPTMLHLILLVAAIVHGWFNPISHKVQQLLKTVDLVQNKTKQELEAIPIDQRTWHKEDAKAVAFYLVGMPRLNALLIVSLIFPFGYLAYIGITQTLVGLVGLFL